MGEKQVRAVYLGRGTALTWRIIGTERAAGKLLYETSTLATRTPSGPRPARRPGRPQPAIPSHRMPGERAA
eukprot:scaffold910_cov115-Isochrysis_galbana.AAC.6